MVLIRLVSKLLGMMVQCNRLRNRPRDELLKIHIVCFQRRILKVQFGVTLMFLSVGGFIRGVYNYERKKCLNNAD